MPAHSHPPSALLRISRDPSGSIPASRGLTLLGSIDQDLIVYPIVYLYRHHIELVLKDVVRMALDLQGKSTAPNQEKKLGGHDLLALWTLARPMLAPVCEIVGSEPLPSDDLAGVDSYMSQYEPDKRT